MMKHTHIPYRACKSSVAISAVIANTLSHIAAAFAIVLLLQFAPTNAAAQRHDTFNPQQFERELEKFVVKEAALTKSEASKFLPIYREMRAKQHAVFDKFIKPTRPDFNNEEECAKAIREHDNNDIKLKQIQRTYHNKFLKVISAKKVMKVIRAEDDFHRNALRKAGAKKGGK